LVIGGSDLGPAMVVEAIKFYGNHLRMHFVSKCIKMGIMFTKTPERVGSRNNIVVVVSKDLTKSGT